MIVSILLFIGFGILLIALYVKKATEWKNSPPGPYIYPIIGSIPAMGALDPVPYKAFHALSLMYGPAVRICLGLQNMMILSSYEVMKEAMNNEDLDDRAPPGTSKDLVFDASMDTKIMSFFSKGMDDNADLRIQWRDMKRFALRSLKDLGFGKTGSEESILDELQLVVKNIDQKIKENNGTVTLGKTLNCAALNVVWNLIGGSRYEYDDAKMLKLIDAVGAFMCLGRDVVGKPLGNIPILRYMPPYKSKMDKIQYDMQNFKKFIYDTIEERKMIANDLHSIDDKCFIDLFLEEQNKPNHVGHFSDDQLAMNCLDIFVAGSETTSKSQEFLIALMMHYPDVQAKVHAELDSLANGRTYIDMNDKDKLPYTEATMNEAWRQMAVAPFGPPRIGHKDVKIGKYNVPKGTLIMYNTHTMHMDPSIWGDPQAFRPERFIANGKFEPSDRLFPFGIGRRRCLGESLARMEAFLFFSNIMLNYSFKPINGVPPSLEPEAGFTNGPYPYSCNISRRF